MIQLSLYSYDSSSWVITRQFYVTMTSGQLDVFALIYEQINEDLH